MDSRPENPEPPPAIACRLCGAESKYYGRQTVIGKYRVAYYECTACGSLETENPYWLDEAYRVEGLGLDVGACQRCLDLSLEVAAGLSVLGIGAEAACLDYGAGLGLFSRLMRDRGWNFFAYDKFIAPFFMDRFRGTLAEKKWTVLTAFEVFEHLVSPAEEIAGLLRADPDLFFFTTQTWRGQGLDWWYIVPQGGQHVFFYSEKALHALAEKNGYVLMQLAGVKLFVHQRLAGGRRSLSAGEKLGYALKKRQMARGDGLPADAAVRFHLLQDRRTMRKLALALFERHQRDGTRHIQADFAALQRAAAAVAKLP
jgi:2-polyprenyl-3-methyl-5-hydroxy-6-metoxy-1,4-benzoquinol methylase